MMSNLTLEDSEEDHERLLDLWGNEEEEILTILK